MTQNYTGIKGFHMTQTHGPDYENVPKHRLIKYIQMLHSNQAAKLINRSTGVSLAGGELQQQQH